MTPAPIRARQPAAVLQGVLEGYSRGTRRVLEEYTRGTREYSGVDLARVGSHGLVGELVEDVARHDEALDGTGPWRAHLRECPGAPLRTREYTRSTLEYSRLSG